MNRRMILNEKDLREARSRLQKLDEALNSKRTFQQLVIGLPTEIIAQVARLIEIERQELVCSIAAFETVRATGSPLELQKQSGNDPGIALIVARIAKNYSQRELAWRLGLKEQQIQRYEAERYKTISLKNYNRIASLLGVQLEAKIVENPAFRGLDAVIENVSKENIRKILKHGRENGWFEKEMNEDRLRQYIAENRIQFGSPSLLRTGLNVVDHSDDILLHAWRARVVERARAVILRQTSSFDPIDLSWIPDLIKLSEYNDGPLRAQNLLSRHGITLIAEPHIPGLSIDGAALVLDERPIIGLTLRKDTLDNFWFTLTHELGHVILHYRSGLGVGFFDETDSVPVDQQELEADVFASNILIPEEMWMRSTARIAKSPEVVERFAKELGINPAIAFGRIRKERNNYSIFSERVGAGRVRTLFFGNPPIFGGGLA